MRAAKRAVILLIPVAASNHGSTATSILGSRAPVVSSEPFEYLAKRSIMAMVIMIRESVGRLVCLSLVIQW